MVQIQPHPLWIGNAGDARAFRELFDIGIGAVVQLAVEEPPLAPPRELVLCRFPLVDGTGNDAAMLVLAVDTVASLIRGGMRTLVCCGAGMSRSPAIAAAALAKVSGQSPSESLKVVAEHHGVDVHPGLWDDVCRATNV